MTFVLIDSVGEEARILCECDSDIPVCDEHAITGMGIKRLSKKLKTMLVKPLNRDQKVDWKLSYIKYRDLERE